MTGIEPPRRWQCWAASVAGPAHRREGTPSQDAAMARSLAWGQVIAVADGLGSRAQSHLGSRAACRAALQVACAPQAELAAMLLQFHGWWLRGIHPHAATDCASTCLFAIRAGGAVTLAQIGDGMAVVCLRGDRAPVVLDGGKENGFANMTSSLGESHRGGDWKVVRLREDQVEWVVLCTDGIADDLVPGQGFPFAASVIESHRALAPARRSQVAQGWLQRWPVPCHSDDKSLACLFPVE